MTAQKNGRRNGNGHSHSHNIGNLHSLLKQRGCCDKSLGHLEASDLHWFNGEVQRLIDDGKFEEEAAKHIVLGSLKRTLQQRAGLKTDTES